MVEEDGGRGARSEEGAVEEGRGRQANPSGNVRKGVDEVDRAWAVGYGMVQVDAQARTAALEKRYLQRFEFGFR